jgi:hypothetical protein
MVAIITLAEDCIDVSIITQQLNNPKPALCKDIKTMPPTNNFERQPF